MFDPGSLAGSVERFRREALTAARLEHRHPVPVYDADEVDGGPFIAMGLIPGRSPADRIAAGPLPPAELVPIVRQVAEALDDAHEHGIVHRGVEPAPRRQPATRRL